MTNLFKDFAMLLFSAGEEIEKKAEEFRHKREERYSDFDEKMKENISDISEKLGLATKKEVEDLNTKIDEMNTKIDSLIEAVKK